VPTVFASDTKKAVHEDATTKVRLELVKHKGRQFAAPCFQIRQKRRPMFLYRSIKVRQELARSPELLKGKRLVIWTFAERDLRFGMKDRTLG
jgi:hypothetical protein